MALSEEGSSGDALQPKPSKTDSSSFPKPERKEKPLTKVVIRRLPPSLDSKTFLDQISPVAEYDYFYLVNGDLSLGENAFSRAYINFLHSEDVYEFKERFDNYVFLDARGQEYTAVVEFSPFQKIPKRRNKIKLDPKCCSIESDPLYLQFVENLKKLPEPDEKPEYSYQITMENKGDKITPLLEYVKNRRIEKIRVREERREERKRKEVERKKLRDDERRRRLEEKLAAKASNSKTNSIASSENVETDTDTKQDEKLGAEKQDSEKPVPEPKVEIKIEKFTFYKNRERKFEERKKELKSKYAVKKEYPERREFKSRRDYYNRDYHKHEEVKKDVELKPFPKKVKKYSEKREERKMEVQRAEQKKMEELQQDEKNKENKCKVDEKAFPEKAVPSNTNHESLKKELAREAEKEKRSEDSEINTNSVPVVPPLKTTETRRERIRNKDRPTIAIYRPGMLTKRRLADGDSDIKETKQ